MQLNEVKRARPSVDPSKPEQVRTALLRLLAERGMRGIRFAEAPKAINGGYDTLIYGFQIEGEDVLPEWRQPLVLRVYAAFDQEARAKHEAGVQRFAAAQGYSALSPLLAEGADNALGLPLMIMPRVPGGTLAQRMLANPLRMRSWLVRMADLHASLHALSLTGCPLPYGTPLIERQLATLHKRIERRSLRQFDEGYAWLQAEKRKVLDEVPALCHADFHPLNILVNAQSELVVIDWTEADVGDRHFDVARTMAAFWFAQLGGRSAVERLFLRGVRGFLRNSYLDAYRRQASLDPERLSYWESFHVFATWLAIAELPFDTRIAKPTAVMNLGDGIGEQMRQRFWECTGSGRTA
jgi:aminoglycoside phosphotransferase (APT) family kinase protein